MIRRIVMHLVVVAQACAFTVGFLSSEDAKAAFFTSGCAAVNQFCTLEELTNPSAFINIDNVVFNNFVALFGGAALIKATPIDSPGSGPGSIAGLRFNPVDPNQNPWFVAIPPSNSPGSFDGFFTYDVNVLSGPLLGRADLATTFIETVTGGFYDQLVGAETISTPTDVVSLAVTCQEAGLPLAACDNARVTKGSSFKRSETLQVEDDVFGTAERSSATGVVQIGVSQLENSFTRVPEPTTVALLPMGLALMRFAMRRKGRVSQAG